MYNYFYNNLYQVHNSGHDVVQALSQYRGLIGDFAVKKLVQVVRDSSIAFTPSDIASLFKNISSRTPTNWAEDCHNQHPANVTGCFFQLFELGKLAIDKCYEPIETSLIENIENDIAKVLKGLSKFPRLQDFDLYSYSFDPLSESKPPDLISLERLQISTVELVKLLKGETTTKYVRN